MIKMIELPTKLQQYLKAIAKSENLNFSLISSIIKVQKVKKGEHFFKYHEQSRLIGIIAKGLFRAYVTTESNEERTFSFIPEYGILLDYFYLWNNSQLTKVSVQALEHSELYTLNYDDFMKVVEFDLEWSKLYREIIIQSYLTKSQREVNFVLYNAKERLQLMMKDKDFDYSRVPKAHLASYLGIAAPSLSRLFKELREV